MNDRLTLLPLPPPMGEVGHLRWSGEGIMSVSLSVTAYAVPALPEGEPKRLRRKVR